MLATSKTELFSTRPIAAIQLKQHLELTLNFIYSFICLRIIHKKKKKKIAQTLQNKTPKKGICLTSDFWLLFYCLFHRI